MTKKLLVTLTAVSAIALSTSAFAATTHAPNVSGFYVTAQAGYSMAGAKSTTGPTLTSKVDGNLAGSVVGSTEATASKKNGLAGRLAVGYNINQYFGAELGGALYHNYDYSLKLTGQKFVNNVDEYSVKSSGLTGNPVSTKLYVIDLLAKASTPTYYGVSAYAKAGVADVVAKTDKSSYSYKPTLQDGNTTVGTQGATFTSKASSHNFVRPEAVAGVAYNITQNIATDVSYSYILGKGKAADAKYLPSLGFASLGLTYKF